MVLTKEEWCKSMGQGNETGKVGSKLLLESAEVHRFRFVELENRLHPRVQEHTVKIWMICGDPVNSIQLRRSIRLILL